MALKSGIALLPALAIACGSSSSRTQSETAPPLTESLPRVEILQRSNSLRLSIRLEPETVDIGQTPAVVTRFENVGPTDLYVNPHLVTGAFLPDLDEPVRCVTNLDYAIRVVTAKDFVRVPPGGAWEQRIAPGDRTAGGPFTRNAPAGTHRVGARYLNYPDCRQVRYDPARIGIPVWEGRLDAPTVSLTIRPLPSQAEKALISRVLTGAASDEDFALVGAQNSPATNAAVIEYLSRQPGTSGGSHAGFATASIAARGRRSRRRLGRAATGWCSRFWQTQCWRWAHAARRCWTTCASGSLSPQNRPRRASSRRYSWAGFGNARTCHC